MATSAPIRTEPCIVCENERWRPLHKKAGYQYCRCTKCGLEVTSPLPTMEAISHYYKSQAEKDSYSVRVKYPRKDDVHEKIASWAIDLNNGTVPKTVLDVGCLTGTLLDVFKEKGSVTYGVELQSDAVALANANHDGRVFNGTIEQFVESYKGDRFDMVTAIGVIEHVIDPVSFLKSIRHIIKSDGLFILQTPNTGSVLHHLMKSYWPPYVPIEHIYLFSNRNLAVLLDKCGYEMLFHKNHWKTLQIEFFYLMTEVFMPFAYKILRHIIPRLPESVRSAKVPLYSGEMLVAVNPVSGYRRFLDRDGKYWLYD